MKVLLIYPQYPNSFWSFKYALSFINKKAAHPPLGLLTVAAMLPGNWEKRLIDLNVEGISDDDFKWADYVFVSAMAIQRNSAKEIFERCQKLGVKSVAGGPLFTSEPEDFPEVDHLVLGEAEVTLPQFLSDIERGTPSRVYPSEQRPDLTSTPLPAWELIKLSNYASMSVQYSRGCPFNCEFCDITFLYGHKPRIKSLNRLLQELESLFNHGWRGTVFIVDDNFIGNKAKLKKEVLPGLIDWMDRHHHPFVFITEVSINLADDDELLGLMRNAGFTHVFVGIETPSEESLKECNKFHNTNRDMISSVKKIQNYGMQVSGGFIVGFDSDNSSIFDRQIKFIQQSGIVTAMVGLLNAPKGTKLFQRLQKEKRLTSSFSGNNTDFTLNFIPKMNYQKLLEGYKKIVTTIYDPEIYYNRVLEFFKEFKPIKKRNTISMFRLAYLSAAFKAMFYLGILEKGRSHYWRLIIKTLFKHPRFLPEAFVFAVYGFHFRKVFDRINP